MVFFFAPFVGVLVAIGQFIVNGQHHIPYGPFLCLAASAVIVGWATLWERTRDIFELGSLVAALLAGCVALMGVMLVGYRMLRGLLGKFR